ncbi:MAG: hypothetical protein ACK4NY_20000, partial [Spirosomataceae bacterium]
MSLFLLLLREKIKFKHRSQYFLIPFLCLTLISNWSFAQTPCTTPIPYILTPEPVTSASANDGRIKLSGDLTGTNRVLISTSALAAPSSAQFNAAPQFSTFTNGYIQTGIANNNQTYYVRVYNPAGTCYTDQTVNFQRINFITSASLPDVDVVITHNGGTYVAKGSTITATIVVRNQGAGAASGLELTVGIPAGLTPTGTPTATQGTYNSTTKKWTIGGLAATTGQATLTMQFTVDERGIRVLTGNITAETETDVDSSPTTANAGEDDQGSTCISTPYDFCGNDIYTISLPSYSNVKWFKDGVEITAGNAASMGVIFTANGPLQIVSLTAQADFTYTMNVAGSCPSGGCCPLRVTPGLPPAIADPANQTICFGGTFSTVSVTNSATLQAGATVQYQWYNNNGAANANTNLISGQTTNILTTLPTAVGVYKYKVYAWDNLHENCRDSAFVTLTINALPTPTATGGTFCEGSTVNLVASGGTSYSWTGPASFSSTLSNPTRLSATTAMSGVYSVTVTNANGCSATATTSVTVNLRPTIAMTNTTVCEGSTIAINPTVGGGTPNSYSWTGPNSYTSSSTTTANISLASATTAMGGVYTLTVGNTSGCTTSATTS